LNEANLLNFEVIVLAVRVIAEVPDFRAAATISDAITKIVPGVYCDIETLMVEAKMIEEDIKKIRKSKNFITWRYLRIKWGNLVTLQLWTSNAKDQVSFSTLRFHFRS
jgi:hypothetical protein